MCPLVSQVAVESLYAKMIRRAQRSDLTAYERKGVVYRGADDRHGRPSLVIVAHRLHELCHVELAAVEEDEQAMMPASEVH